MELLGKHAEIRVSGVKVLDAFDIKVKISNTFHEPKPFGRKWKKRIPEIADFDVTAQKYARVGNLGQSLALAASTQSAGEEGGSGPATVDVFQKEGDASSKVFSGPIWVETGTFSCPPGLIEEEITFLAADEPAFVAGLTP